MGPLVFTVGTRFLVLGLQALLVIIAARAFGPAGSGTFAAGVALVSLAGTLGGFSVGRVLVYHITLAGEPAAEFWKRRLTSVLGTVIALSLGASLVTLGVCALRPSLLGSLTIRQLIVLCVAIPFYVWQGFGSYIFASLDTLHRQNLVTAATRLAYLAVVLAAVYAKVLTVDGFIWLFAVFSAISCLAEIIILARSVRPQLQFHWGVVRNLCVDGLKLHIDTVGGYLISSANLLIINYFLRPSDVGIYQVANQCAMVIGVFPTVAQLFIHSDVARIGPDAAWAENKKMLWRIMGFAACAVILAVAVAPHVLSGLAGPSFASGSAVFRLLVAASLGNAFAVLMSPQWVNRGHLQLLSGITIALGLIGLISAIILVPRMGIMGAGLSTVLVYTLALAVNLAFYKRIDRQPSPARTGIATRATA